MSHSQEAETKLAQPRSFDTDHLHVHLECHHCAKPWYRYRGIFFVDGRNKIHGFARHRMPDGNTLEV